MKKSKKQKSPQAYMEKLQKQIAKDLEEKNFGSLEEANNYIQNKYVGKEINFDKTKSSPKEKAMDLIYEAWESDDIDEKITFAEKAIKLDENCADAYNLLADVKANTPLESLELFAKGIEAGKKSLGEEFENYKGHFWGYHETRPFMRAMAGYSDVLWHMGEKSKSIEVIKEMLQLNPNDNQGMRHILITRLLILNRLLEAEKLYKDFQDDFSAQWHYSKAYLYFCKRSKQFYADKALKEAMEYNPYVPLYLFGLNEMPKKMPKYIGIGDENEAISYADDAIELWANNRKAVKWFVDIYKKMKNELDQLIEKQEKGREDRFKNTSDKE
jgi:tetratricopeptide (TPR) repeat protein